MVFILEIFYSYYVLAEIHYINIINDFLSNIERKEVKVDVSSDGNDMRLTLIIK